MPIVCTPTYERQPRTSRDIEPVFKRRQACRASVRRPNYPTCFDKAQSLRGPPSDDDAMKRGPTLYDTLEVSPRASPQVIKAAYRALAQRNHPDKKSGCDTACEQQAQLNKAYSVLSDPDQRQRYDQSIELHACFIERRGNGAVVRHGPGFVGAQQPMSRPFIFRPLNE